MDMISDKHFDIVSRLFDIVCEYDLSIENVTDKKDIAMTRYKISNDNQKSITIEINATEKYKCYSIEPFNHKVNYFELVDIIVKQLK